MKTILKLIHPLGHSKKMANFGSDAQGQFPKSPEDVPPAATTVPLKYKPDHVAPPALSFLAQH